MSSANLNNLVKTGQLKLEPMDDNEIEGLFRSGETRLTDAENSALSPESRFDLAYNAAHALALAALRAKGYRSSNRYIVFQVLEQTTELGPEVWRVLAKCHDQRNLAEYEGFVEIDDKLLQDLMKATHQLCDRLRVLIK